METAVSFAARRIRVVVVDDQTLLREGIAALLDAEPNIEVVGRGANGQEAIDLTRALQPDVVLTDIRMPVKDGIEVIREIKLHWPHVRVIILTSFVNDGYVLEGLKAGADAYLLKDVAPRAFISSVAAVAYGQEVIEPRVALHITHMLSERDARSNHSRDGLTQRELQLLTLLAHGSIPKEIARQLRISEKTVRNHISNIYGKLGISERSQVVLYAVRMGLVPSA